MSKQFEPREHAPGYARRSFKGGVYRKEVDPVTGQIKSVQVPKAYWEQPEEAIALSGLTEFWEHNNTQFTDERVRAFNDRLCNEYLGIVCTYDYETTGDPEDFKRLVDAKEAFFDAVAQIDGWPYWKHTTQRGHCDAKNLVSEQFLDYCPEYDSYRAYKSSSRDESVRAQAAEYKSWRRECLYQHTHAPKMAGVDSGFRYRDEQLQLGEIELQASANSSEFQQISIYEYLDKTALVPVPGMPDLDVIRGEVAEQTGVDVMPDKFVKIVAEHEERQPDIQSAPEVKPVGSKVKTKRELEMEDLERMVAAMQSPDARTTERGDGSYGW